MRDSLNAVAVVPYSYGSVFARAGKPPIGQAHKRVDEILVAVELA